jgi:hypothetical protein
MPRTFHLGRAVITVYDGWTVTRFPDGHEVHACHQPCGQHGQAVTAHDLGYPDVATMNQDHDLGSPVLVALALDLPEMPDAWMEEAAVLALQRFLRHHGVSLAALAQKGSQLYATPRN